MLQDLFVPVGFGVQDWRFRDCAWAGFSSYGSGFQGCGFKFEGGDLVKQTYTVKFPESPITPNKGIYLRL